MYECRRYRVSGVVQGVGFRYHAQRQAIRYELVGWVRNCMDGDVELVACGSDVNLDKLKTWLHTGPPISNVKNVAAKTLDNIETFTVFSIL